MKLPFVATFFLLCFYGTGWAVCASPTGSEGQLRYDSGTKKVYVCDNVNWVQMLDATYTPPAAGITRCRTSVQGWNTSAGDNVLSTSAWATAANGVQCNTGSARNQSTGERIMFRTCIECQ
jgi:hypothetical protein